MAPSAVVLEITESALTNDSLDTVRTLRDLRGRLARWMAETGHWPRRKPSVHSANPVGVAYMRGVIERYGPY